MKERHHGNLRLKDLMKERHHGNLRQALVTLQTVVIVVVDDMSSSHYEQRERGDRSQGERRHVERTSPKAPRPITFSISKSSLCSRSSFTVVEKGLTGGGRREHTQLTHS
ncbi:hypothetical protein EYF80_053296 [Liparis tanakae]|uniref:Uncharacterized protein n=1 Tax=Liparis tanakae TaxID=230148 RepID=A0A4Z2F5N1_9TELE|nr:hypothetical protein EYF80_053296 [Liparis tanakae]